MIARGLFWRTLLITAASIALAACGDEAETEQNAAAAPTGNQPPIISGSFNPIAIEDQDYYFKPTASDPDGDPILFTIDGKPGWATFDTTTGELSGRPGRSDRGKHRGIVISVTDGTNTTLLPAAEIEVVPAGTPANQAPVISGTPSGSVTAGEFYDFVPVGSDPDGDPISFQITNRPAWASFDPVIGRLSGTPGAGSVGSYGNIIIAVTDGVAISTLPPFVIVVNPPPSLNTPPQISGTPATSVLVGGSYSFTPAASDADGDSLSFQVINLPIWATFNATTGAIGGSPGQSHVGSHSGISVVVSDGQALAALSAFSIDVIDPNQAPVIGGSPPSSIDVGTNYQFIPTASDPDGDPLTFSVSGLPSWAGFNTTNGAIGGTPALGDIGTYNGITVTASDGAASATLGPFSIQVKAANSAPVISGNPPSSVVVGGAYNFVPTASDPDGDAVSFTASGLPIWASISSSTGAITGSPAAGDVGTYSNISIIVSDGQANTSLGPFAIDVLPIATGSATLNWTPPNQNSDGSPLTDLTGYIIYWGTAPGSYSNSVNLANPGLTNYVVNNLLSGTTYYFSVTAYNSSSLESTFSNEASKAIP